MRGSASDGDSLLSQDLGEDSVFNNKVGLESSCVHACCFCLCHPILCLHLTGCCYFVSTRHPLTVPLCVSPSARYSGYAMCHSLSGNFLYVYLSFASLTSHHVTQAERWARAAIMTSSSHASSPTYFPSSSRVRVALTHEAEFPCGFLPPCKLTLGIQKGFLVSVKTFRDHRI